MTHPEGLSLERWSRPFWEWELHPFPASFEERAMVTVSLMTRTCGEVLGALSRPFFLPHRQLFAGKLGWVNEPRSALSHVG